MSHANTVRFHWVPLAIIVISNVTWKCMTSSDLIASRPSSVYTWSVVKRPYVDTSCERIFSLASWLHPLASLELGSTT